MKTRIFLCMAGLLAVWILTGIPAGVQVQAGEPAHSASEKASDLSGHADHGELKSKKGEDGKTIWYCPMHPQIQQDGPGTCPICSMDLVPMEQDEGADMDEALPESLKGLASVKLSPWKQQLIGLKTEKVEQRRLVRIIDTVGRFGGGSSDFASSAIAFTAQGKSRSSGARYIIADVYALDIPYIKVGQKAEVRGFGASSKAVSAKVGRVFPYDETQSRVVRVRVDLDGSLDGELFVNVRIRAESTLKTALPASAVIDTGRRRYVFVEMEPGQLMPHEVELGFLGEDYWEALSGVEKGSTVVVGANFLVDADSQLKAVLRGMGTGAAPDHQH